MRNQIVSDLLYHSLFEEEIKMEEENDMLEHHGVKDQRWGVQNGPPYPLSGENKKAANAAYKEARALKKQEEKARKIEKQRNRIIATADVKSMRKHPEWFSIDEISLITKKRKQLDEGKMTKSKKKVLDSASLNEIKKHPEKYSSEDMKYALERRKLLDAQHEKTKTQVKKEQDLDDMYAKIQKAAAIASAATTIISLGKAGMELANSYKKYKVSDIDSSDKRFQNQFNNLKGIDKNLALDAFNDYWKTNYSLSDLSAASGKNNPAQKAETKGKNNERQTLNKKATNGSGGKKKSGTARSGQVHGPILSSRIKYKSANTAQNNDAILRASLTPGYDWYSDWKKRNPWITLTTRP